MAVMKFHVPAPWEELSDDVRHGLARLFGVKTLEFAERCYDEQRMKIVRHNQTVDDQAQLRLVRSDVMALPDVYPAIRPRQAGKNTELAEEVQVGAIAQSLHQAEKHTTSRVHNLQYHRIIAQRLYLDGIRYVPEEER